MKTLLILVDGMRPDSLKGIPSAEKFISESTGSLKARTVWPSATLPCHMSLFLSVPPERHGTTTNTYSPQVRPVDGICEVLAKEGLRCAMFTNWDELRDVTRPGSLKKISMANDDTYRVTNWTVVEETVKYINEKDPDFVFSYLGWVDEAGHENGWMSEKYLEAVRESWDCIDRMTENLGEDWTVIVTADHGGHGRDHGTETDEDMLIPLFFRGKNFEPGRQIDGLNIMDIAPTVAKLHGCEIPREWEGVARV